MTVAGPLRFAAVPAFPTPGDRYDRESEAQFRSQVTNALQEIVRLTPTNIRTFKGSATTINGTFVAITTLDDTSAGYLMWCQHKASTHHFTKWILLMKGGSGNTGEVTEIANRQDGTNIDFTIDYTTTELLRVRADTAAGDGGTLEAYLIRITD